MRINFNQGPQPAEQTNQSGTKPTASNLQASVNSGLGEDQAQLSGAHAQVEALAMQAAQLPEIREEKVQALRQAIVAGHYQPDPEQVAGAMLAEMTAVSAA